MIVGSFSRLKELEFKTFFSLVIFFYYLSVNKSTHYIHDATDLIGGNNTRLFLDGER